MWWNSGGITRMKLQERTDVWLSTGNSTKDPCSGVEWSTPWNHAFYISGEGLMDMYQVFQEFEMSDSSFSYTTYIWHWASHLTSLSFIVLIFIRRYCQPCSLFHRVVMRFKEDHVCGSVLLILHGHVTIWRSPFNSLWSQEWFTSLSQSSSLEL